MNPDLLTWPQRGQLWLRLGIRTALVIGAVLLTVFVAVPLEKPAEHIPKGYLPGGACFSVWHRGWTLLWTLLGASQPGHLPV